MPLSEPRQPVVSLPLDPKTRQSLLVAGITSLQDLDDLTPEDLAAAAAITLQEAIEVLHASHRRDSPGWRLQGATSALQLLQQAQAAPRISTGCSGLDQMLMGGIAPATVTEFCGVAGVGKTQMGMQLAVNALIPKEMGGLGRQTLYIDTEGSFMPDRVVDMASAVQQQLMARAAESGDPKLVTAASSYSVDSVLSGILHVRVADHTQQLALMAALHLLLQQRPQVVLVVIDSVTFHFRQDWPDMGRRARLLAAAAQQAMAVAEAHSVAVVYMNQVTTRVLGDDKGRTHAQHGGRGRGGAAAAVASSGFLVPALGETWAAAASTRVILFWEGAQRWAYLAKSGSLPEQAVKYEVRLEGIRNVRL